MSRRNLIGLRRCSTIRATSPNHEGVEGTDRDVVWMLTDASAILFMCASLMEVVLFFLLKEAHFYPCSLQVTSRCASRGPWKQGRFSGRDFVPQPDGTLRCPAGQPLRVHERRR